MPRKREGKDFARLGGDQLGGEEYEGQLRSNEAALLRSREQRTETVYKKQSSFLVRLAPHARETPSLHPSPPLTADQRPVTKT